MRSIVPILALGVVFAATGAVAQPMGRGHNVILSAPAVMTATPVPVPTVNSGALGVLPQQTIGAPVGTLGATAPLTPNSMLQNFGALPGEPGSAKPTIRTRHFRRSAMKARRLRRPPAHPTRASTRQASAPARVSTPGPAGRRDDALIDGA